MIITVITTIVNPGQMLYHGKIRKFQFNDLVAYSFLYRIHDAEKSMNALQEDGFSWIEGEGMLPDLLPLYDEIKAGNYQFLCLVAGANNANTNSSLKNNSGVALSQAQEAFFKHVEIDHNVFCE